MDRPFTSSFFIEISSLPALGVLYMVLIPRVPTKVTIGLYGSVVPLDFPEVTNNWFKHLLDLFYSSTCRGWVGASSLDTFCWLLYILVFILFIYCCKDIVKKSDTVLSLSTDVVFLIEKLKLHPRTPRFKQGGDHRRYTSMHLDEEWMEPLSLIECQSPEVTGYRCLLNKHFEEETNSDRHKYLKRKADSLTHPSRITTRHRPILVLIRPTHRLPYSK